MIERCSYNIFLANFKPDIFDKIILEYISLQYKFFAEKRLKQVYDTKEFQPRED